MTAKKQVIILSSVLAIAALGYGFERVTRLVAEMNTAGNFAGRPVPEFELTNLRGETSSMEGLKGQRLALLFFRVACPHCKSDLSELDLLLRERTAQVKLLAVALDGVDEVARLREEMGLEMTLYFDGKQLADEMGLKKVPLFLLVNEEGRIVYSHLGARGKEFHRILFDRFTRGESLAEADLKSAYQNRAVE